MKTVVALAFLLGSTLAGSSAVTPVQKVVQMLTDMKAKGQKEMAMEQDTYKAYAKQVRLTTRELEHEIKTAKAAIEKLTAIAVKADADVASLTKKITANDKETAALEADQKAATEERT